MPTDERVLVIPSARFHAAGYFHGFLRANEAFRTAILDPTNYQFLPRSRVETDAGFKQLIPYVVLRCGTDLFHYRRGSSGTETRLQSLRSIGIGGHISEDDARSSTDPYRTGMLREVTEEVELGCVWTDTFLGFINDDRTPVGQVHLGVVHAFDLESPSARPRESALAEAAFAPIAALITARNEFETWSQFVLAELS